MEILRLNTGIDAVRVRVLEMLEQGKVVACPTDTVYGLLADTRHPEAIQKIFSIKQRSQGKPMGVFVKDIEMAKRFAHITGSQEKFLKSFWPGAVTAILASKGNLPKELGITDTIGMRAPDSSFLQSILSLLDRPLAQTSANISGVPILKSGAALYEMFSGKQEKPDLVIDGGDVTAEPSRVIDLTKETQNIIRQ